MYREFLTRDRIVPIERFAEDGAEAIFAEVEDGREKYVVKDNQPCCVLIHPEDFEDLMNAINDLADCLEVLEGESKGKSTYIAELRLWDRVNRLPWRRKEEE